MNENVTLSLHFLQEKMNQTVYIRARANDAYTVEPKTL